MEGVSMHCVAWTLYKFGEAFKSKKNTELGEACPTCKYIKECKKSPLEHFKILTEITGIEFSCGTKPN